MKQIREKRDREITFIHTGGQTGPRWRALLGKSGPKILVFPSLLYIFVTRFPFHRGQTRTFEYQQRVLPLVPGITSEDKSKNEKEENRWSFRLKFLCPDSRSSKLNRLSYNLFLCSSASQHRATTIISGGSCFQKLEDLVRLALKRLNVSYLTEYRHVWYGLRRGCSRVSIAEVKLDGRPLKTLSAFVSFVRYNFRRNSFEFKKKKREKEKEKNKDKKRVEPRIDYRTLELNWRRLTKYRLKIGQSVSSNA